MEFTYLLILDELKNNFCSISKIREIVECSTEDQSNIQYFHDNYGNTILHQALLQDTDLRIIDFLVDRYPSMVGVRNYNSETPIDFCLTLHDESNGNYAIRKYNILNKVCVNRRNILTLFYCAKSNHDAGQDVRENKLNKITPFIEFQQDIMECIGLHVQKFAYSHRDNMKRLDEILLLLTRKIAQNGNINVIGKFFLYKALDTPVCSSVVEVITKIHTDSLTWIDDDENTPLHYALYKNKFKTTEDGIKIIRLLLGNDSSSVIPENRHKMSPLRTALRNGCSLAIINLLVSHHPDVVNLPRSNGFTELHKALISPSIHVKKMKLIISKATQYTLSSVQNVSTTPLNIAIIFLNKQNIMYGLDIIQLLVNTCVESVGVPVSGSFHTPLHQVVMSTAFSDNLEEKIYQFSLTVIHLFIKAWPDVLLIKDAQGHTPLDIALNMNSAHKYNSRMNQIVDILSKCPLDVYRENYSSNDQRAISGKCALELGNCFKH